MENHPELSLDSPMDLTAGENALCRVCPVRNGDSRWGPLPRSQGLLYDVDASAEASITWPMVLPWPRPGNVDSVRDSTDQCISIVSNLSLRGYSPHTFL